MAGNGQAVDVSTLLVVLEAIRAGATTKPEIGRVTGLGRNVVTSRVVELLAANLIREGNFAPSTGGRAARKLHFNASAGHILVAQLGATGFSVGIADLAGHLIASTSHPCPIGQGPGVVLDEVVARLRELLTARDDATAIWGIGVGLPGPVEFATGKPVAPPIMPGWHGFDVRGYFSEAFNASTWVDNDVNVMALGEFRSGVRGDARDIVFVKVGTGIGAGLISRGQLHRGAQGCAGDFGHTATDHPQAQVCRCGKTGCLEAQAGGLALAQLGTAAAAAGESPFLEALAADGVEISAKDVARGAEHGDPTCRQLLAGSARMVGAEIARLVSFFNPALVVLGGAVAESGPAYLASVREAVITLAPPLATGHLRIRQSSSAGRAGMRGAALMVSDELLSPRLLANWIGQGSPIGPLDLAELSST